MERTHDGSFTVPEIQKMLHVSHVTAYEISKNPRLGRAMVCGQYRILKKKFWKWYDAQTRYSLFETHFDREKYYSSGEIAEMFGWTTDYAGCFLKRHGLRAETSTRRVYTLKEDFIDWYIHQMRYCSSDPRLPPKNVSPTYDIHQVKRKLNIKSNHSAYAIYKKGWFDVIRVGGQTRVDKESFDKWFRSQCRYPLKKG
ncbi:MAG: hypothetical protein IKE27_11535 [Oscillospiraceae bacterium]|nr:hypothetical protein [Oscillospiraceae bacterium]